MLPFSLPSVLHCSQRTFKRVFLCRYKYLYSAYTCCKPCLWYWWAGCTSSWAQSIHRWRNTRPTHLPLRSSYFYMLGMKIRDTFCIWIGFLFLWDPTVVRFEVLLLTVVITVCCDIAPSTLVKVYWRCGGICCPHHHLPPWSRKQQGLRRYLYPLTPRDVSADSSHQNLHVKLCMSHALN